MRPAAERLRRPAIAPVVWQLDRLTARLGLAEDGAEDGAYEDITGEGHWSFSSGLANLPCASR
jgi:hypothetical protein